MQFFLVKRLVTAKLLLPKITDFKLWTGLSSSGIVLFDDVDITTGVWKHRAALQGEIDQVRHTYSNTLNFI